VSLLGNVKFSGLWFCIHDNMKMVMVYLLDAFLIFQKQLDLEPY